MVAIKIVKKRHAPVSEVAPIVEEPKPAKAGVTSGDWVPGPNDKPRPCLVCGNLYWRPCDGQNPNCLSARWYAERKAGKQPTLP